MEGYTWWVADWLGSKVRPLLTFFDAGVYREFIDLIMTSKQPGYAVIVPGIALDLEEIAALLNTLSRQVQNSDVLASLAKLGKLGCIVRTNDGFWTNERAIQEVVRIRHNQEVNANNGRAGGKEKARRRALAMMANATENPGDLCSEILAAATENPGDRLPNASQKASETLASYAYASASAYSTSQKANTGGGTGGAGWALPAPAVPVVAEEEKEPEPELAAPPPLVLVPHTPPEPALKAKARDEKAAIARVFDHWREIYGHLDATMSPKREQKIRDRLRSYGELRCMKALAGYRTDEWRMGDGMKRHDVSCLLRDAEHVEPGIELFEQNRAQALPLLPPDLAIEEVQTAEELFSCGVVERRLGITQQEFTRLLNEGTMQGKPKERARDLAILAKRGQPYKEGAVVIPSPEELLWLDKLRGKA